MGKYTWVHPKEDSLPEYSMKEIGKHRGDVKWTAIDGYVYDITSWAKIHPGGELEISIFSGQDASDIWYAMHPRKELVIKYMKSYIIGRVKEETELTPESKRTKEMLEDFRRLRTEIEDRGYMKPDFQWYMLFLLHVLCAEYAGYWLCKNYGHSWIGYLLAVVSLTIAYAQGVVPAHEFGHRAYFNGEYLDTLLGYLHANVIAGLSASYWNYRHNLHHLKPNMIGVDPNVSMHPLILQGEVLATEYGLKKENKFPYRYQHIYFGFVVPPIIFTLIWPVRSVAFLIKKKLWLELSTTALFYVIWYASFLPIFGLLGATKLLFVVRATSSLWFFWMQLVNHFPLPTEYERDYDFVTHQIVTACNIQHSFFNEWFTFGLAIQIEHHLFPSVSRPYLVKVKPLVMEFCKKHGFVYQDKTILGSIADSLISLKDSGEIWHKTYTEEMSK